MRACFRRTHGFEALQAILVIAVAAAILLTLKLAWASDVQPAMRRGVVAILGPVEAGARSRAPMTRGAREPAPTEDSATP